MTDQVWHPLYAATRASYVVLRSTGNLIRWQVPPCSSASIYPGNVVIMEQCRALRLALWRHAVLNKMKRVWGRLRLIDFWYCRELWQWRVWERRSWRTENNVLCSHLVRLSLTWYQRLNRLCRIFAKFGIGVLYRKPEFSWKSILWRPYLHRNVNEFIDYFNNFVNSFNYIPCTGHFHVMASFVKIDIGYWKAIIYPRAGVKFFPYFVRCLDLEPVQCRKCPHKFISWSWVFVKFGSWKIHSFCSLSYDRSVASSKASSPQGAI
jgi:hypothetical protein